jgi:hypothetical protein
MQSNYKGQTLEDEANNMLVEQLFTNKDIIYIQNKK